MRSGWAARAFLSSVARPGDQGPLLRPKPTASSAQRSLPQASEFGNRGEGKKALTKRCPPVLNWSAGLQRKENRPFGVFPQMSRYGGAGPTRTSINRGSKSIYERHIPTRYR